MVAKSFTKVRKYSFAVALCPNRGYMYQLSAHPVLPVRDGNVIYAAWKTGQIKIILIVFYSVFWNFINQFTHHVKKLYINLLRYIEIQIYGQSLV
jgi:hypothetical protein